MSVIGVPTFVDFGLRWFVRFSNRPVWVKHFQAIKDARVDRRAAGEAAERRAREAAERLRAVKIYGEGKPHHVTAREPLAAPPPRHQAPVEATLDDDFIARHADALAVAEAETYDAAFDPDFLFSCNPVSEIWRGLKRDRAAS
jgi:hypothetical protein